jgi:hypothetical protein
MFTLSPGENGNFITLMRVVYFHSDFVVAYHLDKTEKNGRKKGGKESEGNGWNVETLSRETRGAEG